MCQCDFYFVFVRTRVNLHGQVYLHYPLSRSGVNSQRRFHPTHEHTNTRTHENSNTRTHTNTRSGNCLCRGGSVHVKRHITLYEKPTTVTSLSVWKHRGADCRDLNLYFVKSRTFNNKTNPVKSLFYQVPPCHYCREP